ncbi:hypothetical protein [Cupriavidus campinensis]|uniref:DUF4157 domain-containing protein n=1 Tax=Cupriavidus campinensis TaxID=151783 RepID=A0ABY3ESQ1_9BURK|nr:hypothetical protein [Cupriavidus campinensis]TSP13972.1 hypothetical protein FGG12_05735 [Cupriavidus campinensis]
MNLRTDPPSVVIETNRLIPKRFDGFSFGPLVLIRPGTSAGLLAHELTHVAQFWRRPFTHAIRYQFSPAYRQACEVEAYRAQLAVNGWEVRRVIRLASSLAGKYGLRLTNMEAMRLLAE